MMLKSNNRTRAHELYKAGKRPAEIARKLNISRQRVSQLLAEVDSYEKLSDAIKIRRERVKKLHGDGKTRGEIAAQLLVRPAVVSNDMLAIGLSSDRQKVIDARRAQVSILRQGRATSKDIARKLGVDPTTIARDLRAMGFVGRKRSTTAEVIERRERVSTLWKSHMTIGEISKRIGLPISTLQGDVLPMKKRSYTPNRGDK